MHQVTVRSRITTLVLAISAAAFLGFALPVSAHADSSHHYKKLRTAVLGDSHASGEGGGSYFPETDTTTNRCRRSPNSWAEQMDASKVISLRTFSACAGAKIENVLTTGQYNEPAQLTTVPHNTQVLFLQIGGNNIPQSQLIGLCLMTDCSTSPLVDQTINAAQNVLPGQLDALYTQVSGQVKPSTKVFVMGYGNPFPDASQPIGPNCPYLTTDEVNVARRVSTALNTTLKTEAESHGFTYVDPAPYFSGHDLCGANSVWWGPTPAVSQLSWFHPTQQGYTLYAKAATSALFAVTRK